ncbi:hypothetical protein NPIL_695681 [Nephila pilipes]|uniref:Uncharacterized protein n=1 Tax=Nephila pilipes TaxID=299642 RepID=A0A8X6TDU9_NEPPI|nr:hypothetical protein NPIL_695681 [Nephila pilipes]
MNSILKNSTRFEKEHKMSSLLHSCLVILVVVCTTSFAPVKENSCGEIITTIGKNSVDIEDQDDWSDYDESEKEFPLSDNESADNYPEVINVPGD